jgi:hypothetical protein
MKVDPEEMAQIELDHEDTTKGGEGEDDTQSTY